MAERLETSDIYTDKVDPDNCVNPKKLGSLWINYITGNSYVCTDNTENHNVWTEVTKQQKDELDKTLKQITEIKEDIYKNAGEIEIRKCVMTGHLNPGDTYTRHYAKMYSYDKTFVEGHSTLAASENWHNNLLKQGYTFSTRMWFPSIKDTLQIITLRYVEGYNPIGYNTSTRKNFYLPFGSRVLVYKGKVGSYATTPKSWPPNQYYAGILGHDNAQSSTAMEGKTITNVFQNYGSGAFTGNYSTANYYRTCTANGVYELNSLFWYIQGIRANHFLDSWYCSNDDEENRFARFTLYQSADRGILLTTAKPLTVMPSNVKNYYCDPYSTPYGGAYIIALIQKFKIP